MDSAIAPRAALVSSGAAFQRKRRLLGLAQAELAAKTSVRRKYSKRMHVEQCFRDEKSCGFRRNQSRIRTPAHAHRLLLLMAPAMRLLIALGLHPIKTGQSSQFERRDRRTLSVFKLGLRGMLSSHSALLSLPGFKSVGS